MSGFIFRMPAGTPRLDYGGLTAYIRAAYNGEKLRYGDHARIGTTVRVRYTGTRPGIVPMRDVIEFQLYDLTIAVISRNRVEFPFTRDAHMATGEWISRIVRDNQIGGGVFRVRRRAHDPLIPGPRGYVGPLIIDGDRDRPVEGYGYQVNSRLSGAMPWCNHDGPERPGERCECGMYVPPASDYTRRLPATYNAATAS